MMILEIKRNGVREAMAVHWVSCVPWNGAPKLVAMMKNPEAMGFMGLGPIIDLDDPSIEFFNVIEESTDAVDTIPVQ